MTTADELQQEFIEFKADVVAKFDTFSFLNEDSFKLILKECIQSEERLRLNQKMFSAIIFFGTVLTLLLIFSIYIALFTVPIYQ